MNFAYLIPIATAIAVIDDVSWALSSAMNFSAFFFPLSIAFFNNSNMIFPFPFQFSPPCTCIIIYI